MSPRETVSMHIDDSLYPHSDWLHYLCGKLIMPSYLSFWSSWIYPLDQFYCGFGYRGNLLTLRGKTITKKLSFKISRWFNLTSIKSQLLGSLVVLRFSFKISHRNLLTNIFLVMVASATCKEPHLPTLPSP